MSDLVTSILSDCFRKYVPIAAVVELTRRCNLHCVHCNSLPEKGRPELTFDQLSGVIDELHDLGTLFVTFLGGEPTVSPDFLPLLRHASDREMCIQFVTNGLRLDERTAEELAKLRVFFVGVSLYGATAETHDRLTGQPGSWEKTLRAVRLLRDRAIYVCFKYIAMNFNVHETDAAVKMAEDMRVMIRVNPGITARDNLERDTLKLRVSREQHKKLIRDHIQIAIAKGMVDRGGTDLGCGLGKTFLSVNAYGDVFACPTLPIPAGNVRYCSLKEIWNESTFLKEVRQFPRLDKMHGCPECGLRAYCSRCPGHTFTETGDLYGPSPTACRTAVVVKELYDEQQGIHEEMPLPPGLAHLPGWTTKEVVELSGGGCGTCGPLNREAADGAIPVSFGMPR